MIVLEQVLFNIHQAELSNSKDLFFKSFLIRIRSLINLAENMNGFDFKSEMSFENLKSFLTYFFKNASEGIFFIFKSLISNFLSEDVSSIEELDFRILKMKKNIQFKIFAILIGLLQ
jgi:hypothetical protein